MSNFTMVTVQVIFRASFFSFYCSFLCFGSVFTEKEIFHSCVVVREMVDLILSKRPSGIIALILSCFEKETCLTIPTLEHQTTKLKDVSGLSAS